MNLLHILLFLVYTFLCCAFIKKSKFFAHPVVSGNVFLGIYLARLAAGLVYAYIYSLHPYNLHSDTWSVFRSSFREYQILLHDPGKFFRTIFVFEGEISYANFSQSGSSYWNILKEVLLVKFEALLNVLSFGNYYVNLVLFTLMMLLGSGFFFKALEKIFTGRPYINLLLAFLVPSTVFWTSAIYKDGILFVLMAIIVHEIIKMLDGERKLVRCLLITGFSLAALFLLRTYVALLMIPALTGWIISSKTGKNPMIVFTSVYVLGILSAFLIQSIYPAFDIPRLLSSWQQAFLQLPANSSIPARSLEPDITGIVNNFPQALNFGFLRPFLWDNKGKQYIPFALELSLMPLIFIVSVFRKTRKDHRQLTFGIFCFCLAFTGCLFIGYIVHIIGALVRYRSIFLPFLFVAALGSFGFSKAGTRGQ